MIVVIDDDCVKILQHCKEAIPARNAGGKVIIMEMMRGSSQGKGKIKETEDSQNVLAGCISMGWNAMKMSGKRLFGCWIQ
jgi:hypothetical protein